MGPFPCHSEATSPDVNVPWDGTSRRAGTPTRDCCLRPADCSAMPCLARLHCLFIGPV